VAVNAKGVEFARELSERHHALLMALAVLYRNQGDDEHTRQVVLANQALNRMVELVDVELSKVPGTAGNRATNASLVAASFRVTERGLCLAALVNSQVGDGGFRPLSSVVLDGYRVVKATFTGRSVRWPDVMRSDSEYPLRVIGSVLADNLEASADLAAIAGGAWSLPVHALGAWESSCAGLADFFRSSFGGPVSAGRPLACLGELCDAAAFTRLLGWSKAELKAAERAGLVLALPGWGGAKQYPAMQVVADALPARLGDLLAAVSVEAMSRWHLAYWLALPGDDGSTARIRSLDSSYDAILGSLARYRVTSGGPSPKVPAVPSADQLRAAMKESPKKARVIKAKTRLHRVVAREFGAFYFTVGLGRYDPEAGTVVGSSDIGACYFSLDPSGAFSEILNRNPVVQTDDLLHKCHWTVQGTSDIADVLDLTDRRVDAVVDPVLGSSDHREQTQALASAAAAAGATAVKYRLVEHPSSLGLSLFGPRARSIPEAEPYRRDPFLQSRETLVESEDFWRWLDEEVASGHHCLLPVQTPGESAITLRS
jgi:hypothetical protein